MTLDWMGDHREFVESLIHYCNIYSFSYKPEVMNYKGVSYSFALIQVLEYLLENEERNEKMCEIALRLGITRSNFTKIINRLAHKGLVRKVSVPGNRKELRVVPTPFGRELYDDYSSKILDYHFSKMFRTLDKIPPEYRSMMGEALSDAVSSASRFISWPEEGGKQDE